MAVAFSSLVRAVPGEGPRDARIVLIGEAAGEEEQRQGRPFVGATGKLLEELLHGVGWSRGEVYLDNVVQRRPGAHSNKLSLVPRGEMDAWKRDLHERLGQLSPSLIVALGGLALEALTGKKSISQWRGSILKYQGSMYEGPSSLGTAYIADLIPTFHPAYIFPDPICRVAIERDLVRARDLLNGTIQTPERHYHIRPSIEEVELYASLVTNLTDEHMLTLDIETPGHIACVGFSYDPNEAMCVPATKRYWGSQELVIRALRAIRAMCRSKVPKVLMHGLYDTYWLRRVLRIEVNNWQWDLMCMHHCLASAEPHDLAYIASMYEDHYVYWKSEAKDPESVAKYARDIDALYTYNGMDCCTQRALFDRLSDALARRNLLDFYQGHYRALLPHMLDLMVHGFRVDADERARRAAQAKIECITIEDRLAEIIGKKAHAKKSLSRLAVTKLLYEQLKLPKHFNPDTGSLSADVFVIQRLTHKYPKKMSEIGPLILTHRKQEKLLSFLDPEKVDPDGRFRSSYGFDPSTGRFSSSPNPMGGGDNAQNQDRRVRDTFLADEGAILLRCDLSQAESRIVDMLTLHQSHVLRAHSRPDERDVHREVAAIVFGVPKEEVTEDQRYLTKRAKYAGVYDITATELSRQLAKEAIFQSPEQCQKLINKAVEPPIREWQQRVRATIMRDRVLGNSWGWTFDFSHLRLDRETYKRGYAFQPQSEIAFLMHHWGFLILAKAIKNRVFQARINAHVHDELVISVNTKQVFDVMQFLKDNLERPRRYSSAGPLVVPCTWALGRTWKGDRKWDRFPERDEIERAVKDSLSTE